MKVHQESTLKDADAAIERWKQFRSHWQYRTLQALGADPFMSLRIELVSRLLEAVEAICPDGSRYLDEAQAALGEHGLASIEAGDTLVRVLEALQSDIGAGRGRT